MDERAVKPGLGVGLRMPRRLAPRAPAPDVANGLRRYAELQGDGLAPNHCSAAALLKAHLVWPAAVYIDGLFSAETVPSSRRPYCFPGKNWRFFVFRVGREFI